MKDYYCKPEAGKFYHLFNYGNNGENLFYTKANYEYFLRRYDHFLSPVLDTYAFCLLPNHFHLVVCIKQESEIRLNLSGSEEKSISDIVSNRFQAFFNSYAKSINKQEKRKGSLFQKPFKRIPVENRRYFANLILYVHTNPQLHGIIDDFRQYPWSSYERILKNNPTRLLKNEVLDWFSNPEN